MFNIDNTKEKKYDKNIYQKILTQQNSPLSKKFQNKINHSNKLPSVKKSKKVKQISNKLNISSNISIDVKEKNNSNISMKNISDKKSKVSNFSPDIEDNRENTILLQKIKNIQIQTNLMKKELKKYDKFKKTLNEKSKININNNKKTIQSIDLNSNDYNYKTINNDSNKNGNFQKNTKIKEKFTNEKKNTSKLNTANKIKKTQNKFENKRLLTISDLLNDKDTKISYNISSTFLKYKNDNLKKNLINKQKNELLNKSAENRRKMKYKNKLDLSHSNTHHNHLIKSKSKSKSKSRSIIDKNYNRSISPIRTTRYKEVIGKSYQKKAYDKKIFYSKNGAIRIITNTNSSTNTKNNLRKENYLNKTNINISKSMEKIKKEKTKKIYKSKSTQGINSYNVIFPNTIVRKIMKNQKK